MSLIVVFIVEVQVDGALCPSLSHFMSSVKPRKELGYG